MSNRTVRKLDARKSKALGLWALSWRHDLLPVADFIQAVESGKSPPEEVTRNIATALREFFCERDVDASLRAFAAKLCIKKKQGRRRHSHGESARARGVVIEVLLRKRELAKSGATGRTVYAQIVRDAATKHHVSVRTVHIWMRQFGEREEESLDSYNLVQEALEIMREMGVSPDEPLARYAEIARDRRKQNPG